MFFLIFLLPIVTLGSIFFPVIFSHSTYLNGDTLFSFFYYFQYYAQGRPLVAQNILSGFPIMVSVAGVWFYPVNALFLKFFDAFDAYRYLNVTNLVLTYIFFYLYARRLNFDRYLAVLGSSIFLFSGQLMLWSETLTNTNYYFVLPLSLWLLEIIRTTSDRLFKSLLITILGLVLGFSWTSGHVQFVVYIHTFVVCYVIFFLVNYQNWKKFFISGLAVVVSYLISAAIGWQQIRVILNWQAVSARSGGVGLSDYFGGSYLLWDFIHFLLPFFALPKIPFSNPNLYIGILPLVVLIIGLLLWFSINNRYYRFFTATFLFCLLASIRYSPLGVLIHQLPLFNSFREAPRIMFVGEFAVAIIVISTLRYLLDHKELAETLLHRHLLWWKRFVYYIALPLVVGITAVQLLLFDQVFKLASKIFITYGYHQTAGEPLSYYLLVLKQFLQSSLQSLSLLNGQVLIGLVFFGLVLHVLPKLNIWSERRWLITICVSFLLNISLVYAGHYQFISHDDLYHTPKTVDFITSHQSGDPERFFPILPGLATYQTQVVGCNNADAHSSLVLQQEFILPNLNLQYNLDTISGYDNFMPRRVSEVLAFVGSENAVTGDMLANLATSTEAKINLITERKNVLRMMNVRYLVSTFAFNDQDIEKVWSEVAGPCRTPLSIYQVHDYWPRYFLVDSYEQTKGDDIFNDVIERLIKRGQKPMAILEESLPTNFGFEKGEKVSVYKSIKADLGHDTVAFYTTEKEAKLLVIGNAWLPGWRATIDGVSTKIYRANYIYMAIPISAGEHTIMLHYVY